MTVVDVDLDLSLLESMDFPIRCQHSRHNDPMEQRSHGGDAKFIVRAMHMCPWETEIVDYPACAPWAEYVVAHYGKT